MRDHSPSNPNVAWNGGWQNDPISEAEFSQIAPGTTVTVVKRSPDGSESTRYPAVAVETDAASPWIELVAEWTTPNISVSGLDFVPGDTLREFFSAEHPYNAFAVIGPEGALRGWYGNVTYPAFFDDVDGEQVLVWHDLYLDVVTLADGTTFLLDDDELEESGLPESTPDFAEAIRAARVDLLRFIQGFDAG